MGAKPLFEKMLPVPVSEGKDADRRQLELFQHGGRTWLRMGPLNGQYAGFDRYTVEIPPEVAADLARALQEG